MYLSDVMTSLLYTGWLIVSEYVKRVKRRDILDALSIVQANV